MGPLERSIGKGIAKELEKAPKELTKQFKRKGEFQGRKIEKSEGPKGPGGSGETSKSKVHHGFVPNSAGKPSREIHQNRRIKPVETEQPQGVYEYLEQQHHYRRPVQKQRIEERGTKSDTAEGAKTKAEGSKASEKTQTIKGKYNQFQEAIKNARNELVKNVKRGVADPKIFLNLMAQTLKHELAQPPKTSKTSEESDTTGQEVNEKGINLFELRNLMIDAVNKEVDHYIAEIDATKKEIQDETDLCGEEIGKALSEMAPMNHNGCEAEYEKLDKLWLGIKEKSDERVETLNSIRQALVHYKKNQEALRVDDLNDALKSMQETIATTTQVTGAIQGTPVEPLVTFVTTPVNKVLTKLKVFTDAFEATPSSISTGPSKAPEKSLIDKEHPIHSLNPEATKRITGVALKLAEITTQDHINKFFKDSLKPTIEKSKLAQDTVGTIVNASVGAVVSETVSFTEKTKPLTRSQAEQTVQPQAESAAKVALQTTADFVRSKPAQAKEIEEGNLTTFLGGMHKEMLTATAKANQTTNTALTHAREKEEQFNRKKAESFLGQVSTTISIVQDLLRGNPII